MLLRRVLGCILASRWLAMVSRKILRCWDTLYYEIWNTRLNLKITEVEGRKAASALQYLHRLCLHRRTPLSGFTGNCLLVAAIDGSRQRSSAWRTTYCGE
ncbi:hypothetical protein F5Y19DRAFT_454275 [Xylariaceae sp. FL1651]|nr:hypothetical protein F5Y19DRAFT_454275 [Xylariaceae sp. FL1651]